MIVTKKKGLGLPGVLQDQPDPWLDEQPGGVTPPDGDTGQAPTPPETTPPDLTDSEDGGVTDEMRERRRMLAQRERDAAAAQEPAFQFDQPDSRPLSLPGVQSPSSYARLGGSRALRPYRTPNFTQQQQGSPLDIFEGPGGLRPLSDEELADQVGRQFIRRRG